MLCFASWGQDSPVERGTVVRRELGIKSGTLTVRTAGDHVLRFRFDDKTYVERDGRPIDPAQLKAGDPVEVVSTELPGVALRIAQSIHVISSQVAPRPRRVVAELPKGELTYSGLVLHRTDSLLVLRPRDGVDVEILLRPETRYVDNGDFVGAEILKPNMRVSVNGGRDVAGKVVAYQVVWGSMLAPK
jgi:hypothetical protein